MAEKCSNINLQNQLKAASERSRPKNRRRHGKKQTTTTTTATTTTTIQLQQIPQYITTATTTTSTTITTTTLTFMPLPPTTDPPTGPLLGASFLLNQVRHQLVHRFEKTDIFVAHELEPYGFCGAQLCPSDTLLSASNWAGSRKHPQTFRMHTSRQHQHHFGESIVADRSSFKE